MSKKSPISFAQIYITLDLFSLLNKDEKGSFAYIHGSQASNDGYLIINKEESVIRVFNDLYSVKDAVNKLRVSKLYFDVSKTNDEGKLIATEVVESPEQFNLIDPPVVNKVTKPKTQGCAKALVFSGKPSAI